MFKGIANIASMVRTAQQMGGEIQGLQEQLKTERVSGAAGGGMVEVEANGLGEVLRVRIDSALVEQGEREMIEDLLPAAINQAREKAAVKHQQAMHALGEKLNLPGLNEALSQLSGGGSSPQTPPS
jgi:DNA-binding YbaB/EbfC family protein